MPSIVVVLATSSLFLVSAVTLTVTVIVLTHPKSNEARNLSLSNIAQVVKNLFKPGGPPPASDSSGLYPNTEIPDTSSLSETFRPRPTLSHDTPRVFETTTSEPAETPDTSSVFEQSISKTAASVTTNFTSNREVQGFGLGSCLIDIALGRTEELSKEQCRESCQKLGIYQCELASYWEETSLCRTIPFHRWCRYSRSKGETFLYSSEKNYIIENGVRYNGQDLKSGNMIVDVQVDSHDDCRKLCDITRFCNSLTYDSEEKKCRLKEKKRSNLNRSNCHACTSYRLVDLPRVIKDGAPLGYVTWHSDS